MKEGLESTVHLLGSPSSEHQSHEHGAACEGSGFERNYIPRHQVHLLLSGRIYTHICICVCVYAPLTHNQYWKLRDMVQGSAWKCQPASGERSAERRPALLLNLTHIRDQELSCDGCA